MKKWTVTLISICLLLVCGCALADAGSFCDPVPQSVRTHSEHDHLEGDITDCIRFADTPVGDLCFVLTATNMYGYLLKDGVWTLWAQVSPLPQGVDTLSVFRRHAQGTASGLQGTCGLTYPDGLGFDVLQVYPWQPGSVSRMVQYHWSENDFRLVGWQADDSGQFTIWQDGAWAFIDSTTGETLGTMKIKKLRDYGLIGGFEDLPQTLDEARRMEAITQDTVKTLFPGWTLSYYADMGRVASAFYYRISDGLLTLRRVELSSEIGGITKQTDTMPVALSETLLERLRTEPLEKLLNLSGYDYTFLTDNAFDLRRIPVTDKVLQNDLQTHGLMLLTEDADGVRRLRFVEQDGAGYSVRTSQPLPQDVHLDLFHSGDDEVNLEWDAHNFACSFSRTADGNWTLGWVTRYSDNSFMYGTRYFGIQNDISIKGTQCIYVGSHPWRDLFRIDFTQLPITTEEALAGLNRDGWAVVDNQNPAARLHLRVKPDDTSQSLGEFYNRTPVQVLRQQGDWSRVRIGLDGHLEGWMLTQYLTFGSAMDQVDSASPDRILLEKYENHLLYATAALCETTGVAFDDQTWIVGTVGDELYVLLDFDGNTGYLPQDWFWDGNG